MAGKSCLSIGLSPAIQKTLIFSHFEQGEVNRSEKYYLKAAGKCVNVCRVLTQGGMKTVCLTPAGRENRQEFIDLCKLDNLTVETVETDGRVRTCTTIVERETERISEIVANEPELITPLEEGAFLKKFEEVLKRGFDGAVIAGSRFPGFSSEIVPHMVKRMKEHKILLFADYKGKDLQNSLISKKIRPDYIKINEKEFLETFGREESVKYQLRKISAYYDNCIILSRGPDSTWLSEKGEFDELESQRIKAVNPIGCGDSMTAGLAQGVLEGKSFYEAIKQGREYATANALSIHPGWIRKEKDD